jgi:hypothetical protein
VASLIKHGCWKRVCANKIYKWCFLIIYHFWYFFVKAPSHSGFACGYIEWYDTKRADHNVCCNAQGKGRLSFSVKGHLSVILWNVTLLSISLENASPNGCHSDKRLSVKYHDARCHCATKCHGSECHYAKCHFGESHSVTCCPAKCCFLFLLSVILLNVVALTKPPSLTRVR